MPTRRSFLQLISAAPAAAWLASCGDSDDAAASAVLDPDETSLVVALWSRGSLRMAIVEVQVDGEMVHAMPIVLEHEIGHAIVTGLAPDTQHEVWIRVGAQTLGPHRVRTAPRADDPRPVRIAVSADYDPSPTYASGMIDAIIAAAPELMLTIGDFPYTDNGPPAHTVPEYRARHAALRAHPPIRALLEACGLYAIYDDHDVRNDWDGGTRTAEPERYAAGVQVWDEFFPLRVTDGEIRYRRWRWGAGLECFLLDCRRFRSANAAPDGADKTMLGAAQLRWLIDGVTTSAATFKLVLTSVPLDFGVGNDHWASFAAERDAMFAALVGTPGVLFVSADQHWFAAHRHAFGIREFQVGPLARDVLVPPAPVAGVVFRARQYNAGVIEIDGDRLTMIGIGDTGAEIYRETLTAADLTPRAG